MLSEAEDEYDEMLLKAQPLLDAVSLSGAAAAQSSAARRRGALGDEHGRPERHALVERDDVGDVHADAAVRGARADRAVLAGAVDADTAA